jgi:hypothetical protein
MTIRIFVGTSANDEDLEAQAVYEYSLRKHHPADDLDITWMRLSRDPTSFWYSDPEKREGWDTKTWATPFSALRWGIPAACGYEGRAIYTDPDMIVMDDIEKLWNEDFRGKAIVAHHGVFCTMLMDCAALKSILPPIDEIKYRGAYRTIRRTISDHVAPFQSGDWNRRDVDIDKFDIYDPDAKILHYTTIPTQPTHKHAKARLSAEGRPHWYSGQSRAHPRPEFAEIFDVMLREAVRTGYTLDKYRVPAFGDYRR